MDFEAMRLIDPIHASIATAAAMGSFVSLLITRKNSPLYVITLFFVGQATAFYWTIPIADWRGWGTGAYGPLGFTIGAIGMLFWGAAMNLFTKLRDDPTGTLDWARRLWKGDKA